MTVALEREPDAPERFDGVAGSPTLVRWALAFAVVAALLVPVLHHRLFPVYSGDRDEPVYRYQAQMLEEGRLTIPLAQEQFFRPWLSGPADGHLVMAFQPLWPGVLSASDLLTGTMTGALMLAAAGACLAAYAFALEMLRDRRVACITAGLVALAPFSLVLSATYLNYVFAAALGVSFWTLGHRAVRTASRPSAAGAGALLGLVLLTRPFDAILYVVPLAAWALARDHRRRTVPGLVGPAALAAAPFVAATLAYNVVVTGSWSTFPTTAQSADAARFGWGWRALTPEFPPIHFTFVKALRSLGRNSAALPTWTVGSYLSLALAALGGLVLGRGRPGRLGFLVATTLVFPLGYVAWWASTLTASGAFIGLGPHYYLPALVPLTTLTAVGLLAIAHRRSRTFVASTALVALVLTVVFVAPKLDHLHFVTDAERAYVDPVRRDAAARPGPTVVVMERAPYSYVMGEHGVLANPPDLDARVLYAVDRGAAGIDLVTRHPQRRIYRVIRTVTSGAPLSSIHPVLLRQRVLAAPALTFRTAIVNRTDRRTVTAYARFGTVRRAVVLDRRSHRGERYELTWTVAADGTVTTAAGEGPSRYLRIVRPGEPDIPRSGRAPRIDLAVGAAFGDTPGTRDPDRVELQYYARSRHGRVQLLSAPEHWTRLGAPVRAWLPIDPAPTLRVTPATGAPATSEPGDR